MATKEFGMRTERADETVLRSELRHSPKEFDHLPNGLTGGKDIFIPKPGTVKGSTEEGGLDYRKTVKILHRNGLRIPKLNEILALAFVGDNDIPNIIRLFGGGIYDFWVNVDDESFYKSLKPGETEIFKFDEKADLKKLEEEDETKIPPERKISVQYVGDDYIKFGTHNYKYTLEICALEANPNSPFLKLWRRDPKIQSYIMVGVPDERAKASVWSNILRRNNHE